MSSNKARDKERLDLLVVEKGLCTSRERARALIMAGKVLVNGVPGAKAGMLVSKDSSISLKEPDHPYVSRGGVKLEGALKDLAVDPQGLVAMDVGMSTGGFTDCLLQHGAAKVFGIDVGYGQAAMSLRRDPRVVLFERTNFRHFDPNLLPERPTLAVMDVSFISATLLLDKLKQCLAPGGECLVLVKPQFELHPSLVGKGGVVRDDSLRQKAVDRVCTKALASGFEITGRADSRLPGPKGNREVFLKLVLQQPAGGAVPAGF